MRKNIVLALISLFFLAGIASAQESQQLGWLPIDKMPTLIDQQEATLAANHSVGKPKVRVRVSDKMPSGGEAIEFKFEIDSPNGVRYLLVYPGEDYGFSSDGPLERLYYSYTRRGPVTVLVKVQDFLNQVTTTSLQLEVLGDNVLVTGTEIRDDVLLVEALSRNKESSLRIVDETGKLLVEMEKIKGTWWQGKVPRKSIPNNFIVVESVVTIANGKVATERQTAGENREKVISRVPISLP